MPAAMIFSLARDAGITRRRAERVWETVKHSVVGQRLKSGAVIPTSESRWTPEMWAYVTGAFKHAVGLNPGPGTQPPPPGASITMQLGYDVWRLLSSWTSGHDLLSTIMHRRGDSVDIVHVDLTEAEVNALGQLADEVLRQRDASEGERRVAEGLQREVSDAQRLYIHEELRQPFRATAMAGSPFRRQRPMQDSKRLSAIKQRMEHVRKHGRGTIRERPSARGDILRHVGLRVGGRTYELTTWDTHRHDHRGQTYLGYDFRDPHGITLFTGTDFAGSPMHADDSDESLRALVSFLTLRPGDTDADYFARYTPDQMAFAKSSDCEYLQLYGMEDSGEPFVDLD